MILRESAVAVSLFLCPLLATTPAFAQAAPWDAPAPAATPATDAPAATPAAPATEARMVPGWLLSLHPRNGESTTEMLPETLALSVNTTSKVMTNSHAGLFGDGNIFVPAIYQSSGELNIEKEGDYTFRIDLRIAGAKTSKTNSYHCGVSLNVNETPVIAAQNVAIDQKEGSSYSPTYGNVTSEAAHLPAGRYPASWTASCTGDRASLERHFYQDGKADYIALQASLQVSSDGISFVDLPTGMFLHDANLEPAKPAARTLERPAELQAGYVHGWSVVTYPETDSLNIPTSGTPVGTPVASGTLLAANISTAGLHAMANSTATAEREEIANFLAKTNYLVKQDGRHTITLVAHGVNDFYSQKACFATLDFGPAGQLFNEPVSFDDRSGIAITAGADLVKGAYPLTLSVACNRLDGPRKNPGVDFSLRIARPGDLLPQPIAIGDLVTESAKP